MTEILLVKQLSYLKIIRDLSSDILTIQVDFSNESPHLFVFSWDERARHYSEQISLVSGKTDKGKVASAN